MRVEPEDWLNVLRFALFIKLDGTVQVVEVGQGQRLAPFGLGARHQVGDFGQSLKQRVVRVYMEMYKLRGHELSIPLVTALEPIIGMCWQGLSLIGKLNTNSHKNDGRLKYGTHQTIPKRSTFLTSRHSQSFPPPYIKQKSRPSILFLKVRSVLRNRAGTPRRYLAGGQIRILA